MPVNFDLSFAIDCDVIQQVWGVRPTGVSTKCEVSLLLVSLLSVMVPLLVTTITAIKAKAKKVLFIQSLLSTDFNW